MGKLTRLMKKGDMFGGQWGITFSGDDKHKTAIGCICSLLYLSICVFSVIYFWGQYTDTKHPDISSEVLIGSEFPQLNFGNYSFFFTISAIYEGRPLHYAEIQNIVDIKLSTVLEKTDPSTGKIKDYETQHGMHKCKKEDFTIEGKLVQTTDATINGDITICPNEKHLKMEGHMEDPEFQFIRIQFVPCTTSTCWTNLTTELEKVHIQFGFIEAALMPEDYNHPFKFHLNKEHDFHLDERVEYFRKFFFRTLEVDTDQGNFQDNIVKDSSLDLFNLIYEDGHRHTEDVPYLDIRLMSSNHNLFIQRRYTKFQDFLGNVGGVTSIAAVVISIIYFIYNDMSLKLYIMNSTLFKYHTQKTGKKINMFHVIKFFICKIFGKCFKCFSEETKELTKLFFSGKETLDEHMDVRNLVGNANDLRMIKKILFNEEQLLLLAKVVNDDLVRKVEDNEGDSDEEQDEGERVKLLKRAEDYLDKAKGSDDVEKRINDYLRNSMAINVEYKNQKSLKKSKSKISGEKIDIPKNKVFQKKSLINQNNQNVDEIIENDQGMEMEEELNKGNMGSVQEINLIGDNE